MTYPLFLMAGVICASALIVLLSREEKTGGRMTHDHLCPHDYTPYHMLPENSCYCDLIAAARLDEADNLSVGADDRVYHALFKSEDRLLHWDESDDRGMEKLMRDISRAASDAAFRRAS